MENNPKQTELASRWLEMWREWGKPPLAMKVSFSYAGDGGCIGHVGTTEISIQFDGEPFEHEEFVFQAFRVTAAEVDISELVAYLAGFPFDDGKLVFMFRENWWEAMTTVAIAIQGAHRNAAWAMKDVEAMRALDEIFASEHVAALEATMLAKAASPSALSSRSNRCRL